MAELQEKVDSRITQLRKIIQSKEEELKKAPVGIVNVHAAEGSVQYYYKESSEATARKYLRESEKALVKELCQKDYDQRVLLAAKKELKELEKLQKIYKGQCCEEVYEKLNIHRQEQVIPIWLPDKEYVDNWEAVLYERKGFTLGYPEYYMDKGERVRSKSEIIIANALKHHGVPYRYEYPLYLEDYITFHPDFTVLNIRTREEKYFEHFGMMDDPEYLGSVLKKIEIYEKNGIFMGEKLIATFESRRKPLNQKAVSKWERGINYPDVSMFPKIAEILGSSVPELLGVEAKGTESISELLEQIIKNRKQNEIASIKKCLLEEKKKIFILILSGIMPIGIGYYLNGYMLNHYDFVSYEPIWMAILFAWGYIACFAKKYISNKVVVICSQNLVAFIVLILNMFQEYLLQRYVFQWTQFYYLPLINLGGKFEFTHTITGGCIVVFAFMMLASGIGIMVSIIKGRE